MFKLFKITTQWLRLFYDPNAYRDYVFRQKGYGIGLLAYILMLTMIPSYLQLCSQVQHLFQDKIHQQLQKLPSLHIVNHRLQENDQSPLTLNILKQQNISWFEHYRRFSSQEKYEKEQYLLSPVALLYQLPDLNIFGLQLANNPLYFPIYMWGLSQSDTIDGQDIAKNFVHKNIHGYLLWGWLMSYLINLLYVVIFVRTFAFIARKMVLWFMQEELTYAVACRLLSISGVLPLIIVAMVSYFHPFKEENKYVYTAIYMLNFYFGVRMISSKSTNRWLSTSQ